MHSRINLRSLGQPGASWGNQFRRPGIWYKVGQTTEEAQVDRALLAFAASFLCIAHHVAPAGFGDLVRPFFFFRTSFSDPGLLRESHFAMERCTARWLSSAGHAALPL